MQSFRPIRLGEIFRAEDFVAAVKDATGGEGVDVVLDIIGGEYLPRNLGCPASSTAAWCRSA